MALMTVVTRRPNGNTIRRSAAGRLTLAFGIVILIALVGCGGATLSLVPGSGGGGDASILTVDTVGDGDVQVDRAGTSFQRDTKLRLLAVPRAGWDFDHWEGDASGTDPITSLTMDGNKAVTAVFAPVPADLVRLDVLPVGLGQVALTPPGTPGRTGIFYDRDTTVTLQAEPDPGWAFTGFYTEAGTLLSDQPVLDLVLGDDYAIVAEFSELVPPPPPPYLEETVVGADGQFLGVINDDPFDPDSLANPFGTYGDDDRPFSIWNPFGVYGSEFSDLSAYDPFAVDPPGMYLNGVFEAYLTRNPDFAPRIDPDDVAEAVGRFDVIRN